MLAALFRYLKALAAPLLSACDAIYRGLDIILLFLPCFSSHL